MTRDEKKTAGKQMWIILDKVAALQNNCFLMLPDQAKISQTNYATNLLIAELNGREKPIIWL